MEMYGEACPVLAEVRPWFKDPTLEEMGRKYWKKKSYLFQGFVHENPIGDDKTPENPIRRYVISPQIFNIIKTALMDPEMEELPTDAQRGLDFQVIKTSKGGYADYSTSKWSRKESALTADEQAAIEKFGLYDLSSFLPKKPGEVELKVITEMFEASVDGQPYDAERWAQYYKPYGLDTPAAKPSASKSASSAQDDDIPFENATPIAKTPSRVSAPVADEEDAPVAVAVAVKPSSQKAEDILAMIRNRKPA
jgi:hypothetical protein